METLTVPCEKKCGGTLEFTHFKHRHVDGQIIRVEYYRCNNPQCGHVETEEYEMGTHTPILI